MLYFIAHVFSGESAEHHNKLRRDLYQRFNTKPLYRTIPPHITLKAPFKAEKHVHKLEKTLRRFTEVHEPSWYSINGFGHFGTRVHYLNVIPSLEMECVVKELQTALKALTWLPFEKYEGVGPPVPNGPVRAGEITFHSTL